MVTLRNKRRRSGLSPYFEGPYPILSRRGPNVKLRLRNGKEKVVHLNRCKGSPSPDTEIRFGASDEEENQTQCSSTTDSELYNE